MSATSSAPPPLSVLFARGVIARLAYWPALRIAVDQGWGGPESAEKRTWLASVIVDDFEEQTPAPDLVWVEDRLLQIMAEEFDTVLEDGSSEAVAKDVVKLWEEVSTGRTGLMREFEERAERLGGKKIEVEEAAGDNSDWEDESGSEDEDEGEGAAPELLDPPPKEQPEVDEDGFTTVKGKGRGHR
ncbi:Pre-rRNA-processing protein TSR2-domain-containing protein [Trametes gibbosa]|nr:Pre-rRNA-processing protein TSR2-domain-containing protein [Trametes gibbosa]